MKLYIASSWRNIYQPEVVRISREIGFEVYDFRNPAPGQHGFSWREIDPEWQQWTFEQYRDAMSHPVSEAGFKLDMDALRECDACLLVMPCGRSAHLELGYAIGAGKRTAVVYPVDIDYPTGIDALTSMGHTNSPNGGPCSACGDLDGCMLPGKLRRDFEPELMAKMADRILIGKGEMLTWLMEVRRALGDAVRE